MDDNYQHVHLPPLPGLTPETFFINRWGEGGIQLSQINIKNKTKKYFLLES